MNTEAQRHIDKAASHIAKGEAFYRKAAEEIVAAQAADPTLGYREIGPLFDRSAKWVGDLVRWHTSGSTSSTPFASTGPRHQDRVATRKLLREGSLEEVEQMIAELPSERKQAIAAAAGHAYSQARRDHDEAARNRTPEEEEARQHARQDSTRSARQAVGTFTALGIVGHLEQATEELRELTADASLGPEAARRIERALEAFAQEFEFAKAMLGTGDES